MSNRPPKNRKLSRLNGHALPGGDVIPIDGAKNFTPTAAKVEAMAGALYRIMTALGVETGTKSLAEMTDASVHAAKMSHAIAKGMSSYMAYIDGAIDALKAGTPQDLTLCASMLARAQRDLIATIESVQSDGSKKE